MLLIDGQTFLKEHPDVLNTRVLVGSEHVSVEMVGFNDRLRNCTIFHTKHLLTLPDVAHVIDLTYQTLPQSLLSSMLGNLDGSPSLYSIHTVPDKLDRLI